MGILEMNVPNKMNTSSQNRDFLQVVLAESNSTIYEPIVAELSKDRHQIVGCRNIQAVHQAMDDREPDLLIIGNLDDSSCLEIFRESAQKYQNLPIILLCHTLEVNQFFKDWVISKGGQDVVSGSPQKLHLLRQRLQSLVGIEQSPQQAQSVSSPAKMQEMAPPSAASSKLPSPPPATAKAPLAIAKAIPGGNGNASAQKAPVKAETTPAPTPQSSATALSSLTYQQILAALNQLSETSLRYFGGLVIGNYWKKAHKALTAEHLWLECWSVDHNGVISYVGANVPQEHLTERQFKSLKLWVKGFIKECDRIIADYIELLRQSNPSEQIKQIIADL
jgi:CheY-like chemotaxis protein